LARALIVGCGCRGRELGAALISDGWQVRGTSRSLAGRSAIEAAGIEPAAADPDRPGGFLELFGDVAVLVWALGSVTGSTEAAALHGERLERMLELIVDTPVRGFVYEAAGSVDDATLASGTELVRAAGARWRIPVAILEADPADHEGWVREAASAARELVTAAGA
jgi:nucleoside-diphosphate-sugar epimerase